MNKPKHSHKQVHNLTPSNASWTDNIDRLVLFADFLGFKRRIYTKSHEDIQKEMMDFHIKWNKIISPFKANENLQESQFSDSLIIVVNGTDEKMFNLISKADICLMHVAMKMKLPIKGVISQGSFTFDKKNELYLGRALVDAYLLEEEVKYYGIVVHNTAEGTVKKYFSNKNPYSNTQIYISKGKTCHYHLCWNLIGETLSPMDITEKCKSWIEKIAEDVSGEPRIYVDHSYDILMNDSKQFKDETTNNNMSNYEQSENISGLPQVGKGISR
jgi:hypothetical protein